MGEQQKVNQADTDLNHVLKARRDKLAELQTAGKAVSYTHLRAHET